MKINSSICTLYSYILQSKVQLRQSIFLYPLYGNISYNDGCLMWNAVYIFKGNVVLDVLSMINITYTALYGTKAKCEHCHLPSNVMKPFEGINAV